MHHPPTNPTKKNVETKVDRGLHSHRSFHICTLPTNIPCAWQILKKIRNYIHYCGGKFLAVQNNNNMHMCSSGREKECWRENVTCDTQVRWKTRRTWRIKKPPLEKYRWKNHTYLFTHFISDWRKTLYTYIFFSLSFFCSVILADMYVCMDLCAWLDDY